MLPTEAQSILRFLRDKSFRFKEYENIFIGHILSRKIEQMLDKDEAF